MEDGSSTTVGVNSLSMEVVSYTTEQRSGGIIWEERMRERRKGKQCGKVAKRKRVEDKQRRSRISHLRSVDNEL